MNRARTNRLTRATVALVVLLGATPARADDATVRAAVVAGPAAPLTGYITRTVIVIAGSGADFLNADSVYHDVVANDRDASGVPLFRSATTGDTVGSVKRMAINGVEALPPGTYPFHCTPHASMTGSLVVLAAP